MIPSYWFAIFSFLLTHLNNTQENKDQAEKALENAKKGLASLAGTAQDDVKKAGEVVEQAAAKLGETEGALDTAEANLQKTAQDLEGAESDPQIDLKGTKEALALALQRLEKAKLMLEDAREKVASAEEARDKLVAGIIDSRIQQRKENTGSPHNKEDRASTTDPLEEEASTSTTEGGKPEEGKDGSLEGEAAAMGKSKAKPAGAGSPHNKEDRASTTEDTSTPAASDNNSEEKAEEKTLEKLTKVTTRQHDIWAKAINSQINPDKKEKMPLNRTYNCAYAATRGIRTNLPKQLGIDTECSELSLILEQQDAINEYNKVQTITNAYFRHMEQATPSTSGLFSSTASVGLDTIELDEEYGSQFCVEVLRNMQKTVAKERTYEYVEEPTTPQTPSLGSGMDDIDE